MITVAEDAMWAGITAAAMGVRSGRGRLTDISHAVQSSIRAAGRYGIVEGYGGSVTVTNDPDGGARLARAREVERAPRVGERHGHVGATCKSRNGTNPE